MPSPSCSGFCLRPRERFDTSGRAKRPFAPPPQSGGSQLWGADALRLQAQAFGDITALPSRGCIHNTLFKENLMLGRYFAVSSVTSAQKYSMCSIRQCIMWLLQNTAECLLCKKKRIVFSTLCGYILQWFTCSCANERLLVYFQSETKIPLELCW